MAHYMESIVMALDFPETWSGNPVKLTVTAILTIIVMGISILCLKNDIQVVFTHLYYIPIILAAYWFERKGVLLAVVMAIFYIGLVYAFCCTDLQAVFIAITRAIVFIGISIVSAVLSTTIHRQRDQIMQSEGRFRGVWDSIQAGIILVDAKRHTIIAANPEAEKMTGFSEDEMVGHICHKYICPAEQGKCPISDLGLTVDHTERVLLSRDGKGVPVLKTVTEMQVDGDDYYIESFIDISDLKDAENTLLAYFREATLRIRNPVELVRDNLKELEDDLKGRETNPAYVITALAVQEKNIEGILDNLQEIDRAVAEKRTEIPAALREYLKR